MVKLYLSRLGLILFGLLLALIFFELLIIVVINIYSARQELLNTKSFSRQHNITILALGESTTQVGGEYSWPSQLEKILNSKNLGYNFSVINKGESGTTTERILSNLTSNLNEYQPDIVISMIGINDARSDANIYTSYQPEFNKLLKPSSFWERLHLIQLIKFLFFEMIPIARAEDSQTLINQATRYQNMGDFKNAILSYKHALEINPGDPNIYVWLGILYRDNIKDYEIATEYFQKAVDINPNDQHLQAELIKILGYGGKFDQAYDRIENLLRINPNNVAILSELESLYRLENQTQKAEEISKQVLGINSATATNYKTLKQILKDRGIKLVAVQYPMRNIKSLIDILGIQGVIYVDNEKSFKEAVSKDNYNKYFNDHFGGDFGHATKEGNFLLASNIAKIVEDNLKNLTSNDLRYGKI